MAQRSTETYGFNVLFSHTPDDNTDITGGMCRGFMVGADGNIAVTMAGGGNVTIPVLAGNIYPIQITRVLSTGTTATGILVGR